MHLYRLDDDTVINLEFLMTIGWGMKPLPPYTTPQLMIRLASVGVTEGPITYYLEGPRANHLWEHILKNVVEIIP